MDTTKIEIVGKNLYKIVQTTPVQPNGLTTTQVALYAAAIGASAAILAQLIIFFLTRYKERDNLKQDLIAEERRLALLLTEYYKELVMHKVHKQYWIKTSDLPANSEEEAKDWYNRHFLSSQRSFETLTKIKVILSDYYQTVTRFINLTCKNEKITQVLKDIKSFKPRKASTFDNVETYSQLLTAHDAEENSLNEVYLYYSNCFDKINGQMTAENAD
jgi:hypothetical protein